ncbi:hypothetical protein [Novipirellula aureliae]|nr:hypothetical protein [Novipirellula aureliae]
MTVKQSSAIIVAQYLSGLSNLIIPVAVQLSHATAAKLALAADRLGAQKTRLPEHELASFLFPTPTALQNADQG